MEDPWQEFKKKLNLVFVRFCSDGEVDWMSEQKQIKQLIVRGLAANTSDPPPPTSNDYPPLEILNHLLGLLKKIHFPPDLAAHSKASDSLIVKSVLFQEYFFGLLNVLGFMLSQLMLIPECSDDEGDTNVGNDNDAMADVEDAAIREEGINEERNKSSDDEVAKAGEEVWDEGFAEVQYTEHHVAHVYQQDTQTNTQNEKSDENATHKKADSDFDNRYIQPIMHLAADLFVRIVSGAKRVLEEEKILEGKSTLYDKYKKKIAGSPEITPTELAIQCIGKLSPPMQEIFGRSHQARKILHETKGIENTLYFRTGDNVERMIYQLGNILDEDFIVLYIPEKKGFKVHITGCSDNYLFGMALAASIINNPEKKENQYDLITGQRPPEEILELLNCFAPQTLDDNNTEWSHPFSMSNWTAIKPDGTVESGMKGASHWIMTEGIPSEILKWRGNRVVVLNKAPFERKFSPVRVFEYLKAQATVLSQLTPEEYSSLIKDISSTDRKEREVATNILKTHWLSL